MKKSLKILAFIAATALTLTSFTGCKKTDNASGTDAKNRENVNLTWYMFGDAPKKPDKIIEKLNQISGDKIQTTIDFKFATASDEKVKTMMSTGGKFDITFTCSWFANYVVAAQGGQLADITDKVKTVTPELYDYIPELVWDGSKVDGKIYAIPTYKDTAGALYWLVNKEYVIDGAKAEAELKATGKELSTVTPLLEKIKAYADSGNAYPMDLPAAFNMANGGLTGYNAGWDNLGLDALRLGIDIDSGKTVVEPHWENANMVKDFKTLKSWMDNGLSNKNALTQEKVYEHMVVTAQQGWDGAEAIWGNGKPYTVAINKRYGPVFTTSSIQGSMNGISPNSKNIDRALEFLQFANLDKEYRNILAYGIEGENWEVTSEGNAKALNDDWTPSTFAQASFFQLYPLAPAKADMYEKLKEQNDTAFASPLVGFVPKTDSFKNEIAACGTIISKYSSQLQTGDCTDVDATIQQGMKELRAAGYDTIIKELQKQVDEFLAAK